MENIIRSTTMDIGGFKVHMVFAAEEDTNVIPDVKENILQTSEMGMDSGAGRDYNDGGYLENSISLTPSSNHSLEAEKRKGMVFDDG